jgi:hypothetical protein
MGYGYDNVHELNVYFMTPMYGQTGNDRNAWVIQRLCTQLPDFMSDENGNSN